MAIRTVGLCLASCGLARAMWSDQPYGESALSNVHANVKALESQLSQLEVSNKEKINKLKARHEHDIQAKHQINDALARENVELHRRAGDASEHNIALRKRAVQLQAELLAQRHDLKALQSNMTSAVEIIGLHVNGGDNSPHPELSVLKELDEADELRAEADSHRQKLHEVTNPDMSALQISANNEPRDILQEFHIGNGIDELHKDYMLQEAALTAQYKKRLAASDDEYASLMQEKNKLLKRVARLEVHGERIQKAVDLLRSHLAQLAEVGASVRSYAQKLGKKQMPSDSSIKQAAMEDASESSAVVQKPHEGPVAGSIKAQEHQVVGDHSRDWVKNHEQQLAKEHREAFVPESDTHTSVPPVLAVGAAHPDATQLEKFEQVLRAADIPPDAQQRPIAQMQVAQETREPTPEAPSGFASGIRQSVQQWFTR